MYKTIAHALLGKGRKLTKSKESNDDYVFRGRL